MEWTNSLFGDSDPDELVPTFAYPYDPADGRENAEAAPFAPRGKRGGSWGGYSEVTRTAVRGYEHPAIRDPGSGFRVVVLP